MFNAWFIFHYLWTYCNVYDKHSTDLWIFIFLMPKTEYKIISILICQLWCPQILPVTIIDVMSRLAQSVRWSWPEFRYITYLHLSADKIYLSFMVIEWDSGIWLINLERPLSIDLQPSSISIAETSSLTLRSFAWPVFHLVFLISTCVSYHTQVWR